MKRVALVVLLTCLVPAVAKADRGSRYSHGGGSRSGFSISLGFGSSSYESHSSVGFGYSRGYSNYGYSGYRGGYCAPTYYAPTYCAPPVVYAPAPVYVAPAPIYYAPPVIYAPAPRVYYYDPAPCYAPRTSYYESSARFSYHR